MIPWLKLNLRFRSVLLGLQQQKQIAAPSPFLHYRKSICKRKKSNRTRRRRNCAESCRMQIPFSHLLYSSCRASTITIIHTYLFTSFPTEQFPAFTIFPITHSSIQTFFFVTGWGWQWNIFRWAQRD